MTEHITVQMAQEKLAASGQRFVSLFHHGSLELEFYAPSGTDPQQPHTRDEVYFIVAGTGVFCFGKDRRRFAPGDVFYVPAGMPHRFEDFSADFATWAIFAPAT